MAVVILEESKLREKYGMDRDVSVGIDARDKGEVDNKGWNEHEVNRLSISFFLPPPLPLLSHLLPIVSLGLSDCIF